MDITPDTLAQIMKDNKLPEPPAATPAPAASDQQPATAAPVVDPAAQPAAPPDFDTLLSERSGGKFKKWDELQTRLNQPPPTAQPAPIEWKDDEAKRIFEATTKGEYGPLYDYLGRRMTLAKVPEMNADDAIKTQLSLQYPDLTPVEVERYFKKKYSADTEGMNEVQLADVNADIALQKKIDAAAAKQWLTAQQKEVVFPKIASTPSDDWINLIPPQAAKYIQDMEKVDQFTQAFTTAIPATEPPKALTLSFEDKDVQGGKFENVYDLAPDQQQFVKQAATNFWQYIESRYAKDGKYDVGLMMSDIAQNEYGVKANQSSVRKALGLAALGVIKDIKNFQEGGQQSQPAKIDAKDAIINKAYGNS